MSLTGVEESLRLLDEWAKDKNRRKLERARAEGFTSVEAYTRHLTEEREQQDIANEEYIREQCKATGQTREEYDTELFRGNIKSPVSFLPPRVDCDCKGWFFPLLL